MPSAEVVEHPLARLREAVERGRQVRPGERCEMCAEAISPEHRHVVDVAARTLKCLCQPCLLLFSEDAAAKGRYRQVPTRYAALAADGIDDASWDALAVPVSLAFFFHNSAQGRAVAFYPGPAGATESLLPLDAWQTVLDRHPEFAATAPDVEAVMVRRLSGRSLSTDGESRRSESDGPVRHAGEERASGGRIRMECFIVPIDACYELVGRLRMNWNGFDGGSEAHAEIDRFFARVRSRAKQRA